MKHGWSGSISPGTVLSQSSSQDPDASCSLSSSRQGSAASLIDTWGQERNNKIRRKKGIIRHHLDKPDPAISAGTKEAPELVTGRYP